MLCVDVGYSYCKEDELMNELDIHILFIAVGMFIIGFIAGFIAGLGEK